MANPSASAQEKLLHSFTPQGTGGANPYASLIADAAGNRYGTTYSGGTYNGGTVFELSPSTGGGWTEKILYNFKTFGGDGFNPNGGVIFDTKGNLYGTTTDGGTNCIPTGCGTVFELSPGKNGSWTETVLHSFNDNGSDGSYPYAGLTIDASGNLYGTTEGGGGGNNNCCGSVFEMSPKQGGGWTETVLYGFLPVDFDAENPQAGVIFDAHGNLYGVAQSGGANFYGAVFELSPKKGGGWAESVIYSFCPQTNCPDGSQPLSGDLVLDAAGNLYGTTQTGGAYSGGVVFELSPHSGTWTETVLHSFGNGTDGNNPGWATLIPGPDNTFFGTTLNGGLYKLGTAFQLSPKRGGGWTETVLYNFNNNGTNAWLPYSGLLLDEYGHLYGTTAGGGSGGVGVVFELIEQGGGRWKQSVLYNFHFNGTDGSGPQYAPLVRDAQGNLYGTTTAGGAYDGGTAFELKPNGSGGWTEELLYSFGGTGTDANVPFAGLIFDAHGNLYGTTTGGGAYGQGGTVFELSPNGSGGWTEKVLHSFQNNGVDGYEPFAGLVFDAAGDLYGTTFVGGTYQFGTVFELSPNGSGGWTEQVIHSFNINTDDGLWPYAGLTIDSKGNLYGTTYFGGLSFSGTVFELSPDGSGGWTENLLYSFCYLNNCQDGSYPYGGLVFDAAGNLYGTTSQGGGLGDFGGTIFKLAPQQGGTWTETTLYNFCTQNNCGDGAFPYGSLTFFGSSGNLYGTAYGGGANYNGVVFELTPGQGGGWTETVLHSFNFSAGDGAYPEAGVIFDPSGNLYGVTYYGGGNYNAGAVFELENAGRRFATAFGR